MCARGVTQMTMIGSVQLLRGAKLRSAWMLRPELRLRSGCLLLMQMKCAASVGIEMVYGDAPSAIVHKLRRDVHVGPAVCSAVLVKHPLGTEPRMAPVSAARSYFSLFFCICSMQVVTQVGTCRSQSARFTQPITSVCAAALVQHFHVTRQVARRSKTVQKQGTHMSTTISAARAPAGSGAVPKPPFPLLWPRHCRPCQLTSPSSEAERRLGGSWGRCQRWPARSAGSHGGRRVHNCPSRMACSNAAGRQM